MRSTVGDDYRPSGARRFYPGYVTADDHFGPVDQSQWPRALEPLLGATPLDCAVFPVRVSDGVAAFLYADRLGQPMRYQDFSMIARAAAAAANLLAQFMLRQNTPVE